MQGDYEKAVQYFGRCYELCTQLNDPEALHAARVQYGIARGHQLFQDYASTISTRPVENLERLIAWKDDRVSVSEKTEEKPEYESCGGAGGDCDVSDGDSGDGDEPVEQVLQDRGTDQEQSHNAKL